MLYKLYAIYKQVDLNKGKAYNSNEGILIAPVTGTYVFVWSIATRYGRYQNIQLTVDEKMSAQSMSDAYGSYDYDTATNTAVLQVSYLNSNLFISYKT